MIQVKLGLIGSSTFAEKVATVFTEEYDCQKVVVTAVGKYYRVTLDFKNRSTAKAACKAMLVREFINNYYFVDREGVEG